MALATIASIATMDIFNLHSAVERRLTATSFER